MTPKHQAETKPRYASQRPGGVTHQVERPNVHFRTHNVLKPEVGRVVRLLAVDEVPAVAVAERLADARAPDPRDALQRAHLRDSKELVRHMLEFARDEMGERVEVIA